MPLFLFIFKSQIGIETSKFYSILFGGCMVVLWRGREVVWRLVCFRSALTSLWLGLKSAVKLYHFPMGIDSADTSQQPNGEICMVQSLLLPNIPSRQ